MNTISEVGACPQLIKSYLVSKAIAKEGDHEYLVDAGQHYNKRIFIALCLTMRFEIERVETIESWKLFGDGYLLEKIESTLLKYKVEE